MNVGCRNFKKGDIIKGLQLISDPYKIDGDRNYRGLVKCTLCDSLPFETVLGDIKYRIFDGCGCQKNRSNSRRWKSFKTWCIENDCEYLLDLWDYDLNKKDPDSISCRTADYYYFKCSKCRHPSTSHQIMSIAASSKNKKDNCKYCNSFAQHAIDQLGENALELYWDYDKNEVDPWDISYKSHIPIWIKCVETNYHGSYETIAKQFFMADGKCPYCCHRRIHSRDSFAYYYIQKYGEDFLDLYWDYDKNILDPWKIAVQTNKDYIYLKCEIHGTYRVLPSNFYKFGITCPECSRERDKSKLQEKVEQYIVDNYNYYISHEYSCSIVARSTKTGRWLPYDNDVLVNSNTHLIIEVMGDQHYNVKSGLIRRQSERRNILPENVLAEIQWRDEYKRQYALSQGYHYLAIPYWTEQDGSYKTLIDQKIQEILNNTKLIV